MIETGPSYGAVEFPLSENQQMCQFLSRIQLVWAVITETTPCYDNSAGILNTAKHRRFIFLVMVEKFVMNISAKRWRGRNLWRHQVRPSRV